MMRRWTWKTLLAGTRQSITGTVYRTIVVLSVVTAGAKAYDKDPADLP
jgi:type IV secretory pathway VirB2 component (pilin)